PFSPSLRRRAAAELVAEVHADAPRQVAGNWIVTGAAQETDTQCRERNLGGVTTLEEGHVARRRGQQGAQAVRTLAGAAEPGAQGESERPGCPAPYWRHVLAPEAQGAPQIRRARWMIPSS